MLGESAAGRPFAGRIEPGTAARILTGGVLPDGADCVVMVEDVALAGELVTTPPSLRPGATSINRGPTCAPVRRFWGRECSLVRQRSDLPRRWDFQGFRCGAGRAWP